MTQTDEAEHSRRCIPWIIATIKMPVLARVIYDAFNFVVPIKGVQCSISTNNQSTPLSTYIVSHRTIHRICLKRENNGTISRSVCHNGSSCTHDQTSCVLAVQVILPGRGIAVGQGIRQGVKHDPRPSFYQGAGRNAQHIPCIYENRLYQKISGITTPRSCARSCAIVVRNLFDRPFRPWGAVTRTLLRPNGWMCTKNGEHKNRP